MDFETLSHWTETELRDVVRSLPARIRDAARKVTVAVEPKPGGGPFDDDLFGDELGLFEGATAAEEGDPADMPRIRLFVENLWEWVEGDEEAFRDEVVTTYLHELGHYLGWDEEDLAERGLD